MPAATEVRVWTVDLDGEVAGDLRLLSPAEVERARTYGSARARRRFVAARAALRQVLGEVTGRSPGLVEIGLGPHGKPELHDRDSPAFNLSHSGPLAVIAVSDSGSVGVDVEQLRPRRHLDGVARRTFGARERELLEARRGSERLEFFYAAWTAKEAHLKALGTGFGGGRTPVEAPPWPEGLEAPAPLPDGRFSLRRLAPAAGYLAAVVAEGSGWRLRHEAG